MNLTNDKTSRRIPFTVPEGYFDQLEKDISRRTEAAPETSWVPATLRLAGIAAVIALAGYVFFPVTPSAGPEELLASVGTEHLEAYLTEHEGPYTEDILLPASLTDDFDNHVSYSNDTTF